MIRKTLINLALAASGLSLAACSAAGSDASAGGSGAAGGDSGIGDDGGGDGGGGDDGGAAPVGPGVGIPPDTRTSLGVYSRWASIDWLAPGPGARERRCHRQHVVLIERQDGPVLRCFSSSQRHPFDPPQSLEARKVEFAPFPFLGELE